MIIGRKVFVLVILIDLEDDNIAFTADIIFDNRKKEIENIRQHTSDSEQ